MNFANKFDIVMKQIDSILNNDNDHNTLKKFVEGYKIEKSIQDREDKKIEESFMQNGVYIDKSMMRQRNQIVGLSEIKEHERIYAKAKYENIAKREINRMKERERNNEFNSKIENEMRMNRKRLENYEMKREENKNKERGINLVHSNNIKKKEFSDFVNKMNIERIQNNNNNYNKIPPSIQQCKPNVQQSHKLKVMQRYNKEMEKDRETSKINRISNSQQHKENTKLQLKSKGKFKDNDNDKEKSKEKRTITITPEAKATINNKSIKIQKDYLKEGLKYTKKNRENKLNALSEQNMKFNNQQDYANNINHLKFQAKKYEDLAKKQEQLIKLNGGPMNNIKASELASNYLFDSIVAKISLLKQIGNNHSTA